MNKIENEYEQLLKDIDRLEDYIEYHEKYKSVMNYIKLIKKRNEFLKYKPKLYEKMKIEQYSSCNHIFVDVEKNKNETYKGCIKCGLDTSVKRRLYEVEYFDMLSKDDQIMYKFIKNNNNLNGLNIDVNCTLEFGNEIFKKIISKRAFASDEEIVKLFFDEINNLRNSTKTKKNKK